MVDPGITVDFGTLKTGWLTRTEGYNKTVVSDKAIIQLTGGHLVTVTAMEGTKVKINTIYLHEPEWVSDRGIVDYMSFAEWAKQWGIQHGR